MFQHQFGVVAAGFLLDHGGDAGRGEPRQQHRRLDLGRGHRGPVEDRHGIARAVQRQRQAAAFLGSRRPWRPSIPADRGSGASGGSAARRRRRTRPMIGQPATAPITSRQPVPELPKSSGEAGWAKPADADAPDLPGKRPGSLHLGAQRLHRFGGIEDVFALQQAGNPGFADRKRPQDQGPVRNRLVAGNADFAAQRAAGAGFQRGLGGLNGSRLCPLAAGGSTTWAITASRGRQMRANRY